MSIEPNLADHEAIELLAALISAKGVDQHRSFVIRQNNDRPKSYPEISIYSNFNSAPVTLRTENGAGVLPRNLFISHKIGDIINGARLTGEQLCERNALLTRKLGALIDAFDEKPLQVSRVAINIPSSISENRHAAEVIHPISRHLPLIRMTTSAAESGQFADTVDYVATSYTSADLRRPLVHGPTSPRPLVIFGRTGFPPFQSNVSIEMRVNLPLDEMNFRLDTVVPGARFSPPYNPQTSSLYFDLPQGLGLGLRLDFRSADANDINWYSGETARKFGEGIVVSPDVYNDLPPKLAEHRDKIKPDNLGGGLAPTSLLRLFHPRP